MLNNEEFSIKPSTIETIDTGFYEHVNKSFNIHTVTNGGFKKVPVLWLGPERAFQVKNDRSIRDSVGKLKLPLITIERTSMVKDPSFKGVIQADIRNFNDSGREYRGGAFRVVSKINQEKTAQLQNTRNSRIHGILNEAYPSYGSEIVYDDYFIPVPTYVAITYSITLRSEYQQQMNQMLTPFITRTGQVNHFVFEYDGHRFESFIQQDFSQTNNVANMAEDERSFSTKVDIKVLGYLIGEGINEERPKIIKRETIVRIETINEVVLSGASIADAIASRASGLSMVALGGEVNNGSLESSNETEESVLKSLSSRDSQSQAGYAAKKIKTGDIDFFTDDSSEKTSVSGDTDEE